jgi:hypothetical protein
MIVVRERLVTSPVYFPGYVVALGIGALFLHS